MTTVIIPCAGQGKRFADQGYKEPKPLINVKGKFMIDRVLSHFSFKYNKIFLVVPDDHVKFYKSSEFIKDWSEHITLVPLLKTTEGAAQTVLHAEHQVNPYDKLIIANSDQIVLDHDFVNKFIEFCDKKNADGGIACFHATEPKWSFAKIENGLVTRVAEKDPISENATVGFYYFRYAKTFFDVAKEMIAKNDRVKGEFYVCPVYNYLIKDGKKIVPYFVNEMVGLGTPEDLKAGLNLL